MSLFPGDRRIEGRVVTRWTLDSLVLQAFKHIRDLTLKSLAVMEQTDIQLPYLYKKTLQQWYVFLLLILLYSYLDNSASLSLFISLISYLYPRMCSLSQTLSMHHLNFFLLSYTSVNGFSAAL